MYESRPLLAFARLARYRRSSSSTFFISSTPCPLLTNIIMAREKAKTWSNMFLKGPFWWKRPSRFYCTSINYRMSPKLCALAPLWWESTKKKMFMYTLDGTAEWWEWCSKGQLFYVFTCPLEWIPQPAGSNSEVEAPVPACLLSTPETFLVWYHRCTFNKDFWKASADRRVYSIC